MPFLLDRVIVMRTIALRMACALLLSCTGFFVSITTLHAANDPPPDDPPNLAQPSGLVSQWLADGDARDSQGRNDGKWVGDVSFEPGIDGQAFRLRGINHIVAPTNGLPVGKADRTIALWVKVEKLLPVQSLLVSYGQVGTPTRLYSLSIVYNALYFTQWGEALSTPALQPNRWNHVAVTNVGNALTLYHNGVAVITGSLTIDTAIDTGNDSQLMIGNGLGVWTLAGDMLIDQVEVYNRDLSASEIQQRYRAYAADKREPAIHLSQPISKELSSAWNASLTLNSQTSLPHYIIPIHASVPADTPLIPVPAVRDAAISNSGILLQAGDVVTVNVLGKGIGSTGAIPIDANGWYVDPQTGQGMQSGGYWVTVRGEPAGVGSVVGMVKSLPWATNDWFLIGTHRVFTVTQPGELLLLYHDALYGEFWVEAYRDNSGGFIADVQVQRAASAERRFSRFPIPNNRTTLYNYLLLTPLLILSLFPLGFVWHWRRVRTRPNPPTLPIQLLNYLCWLMLFLSLAVHLLTIPLQLEAYNFRDNLTTLQGWGLTPRTVALIILLPQKFTILAMLVCAVVLLRYQPRDPMALLTALALITFSELVGDNNDFLRKTYPLVATLPVDMLKGTAHGVGLLMAFMLPNGRLFPRWVLLPLALHVGWHLLSGFGGYSIWSTQREVVWSTLDAAGLRPSRQSYLAVWWLLAIVAQVARYAICATAQERKQIHWLLLGLTLGFAGWYLEQGPFLEWYGSPIWTRIGRLVAFHLGFGLFAVALLMAVLRNRLFDIDILIRRSLVWGALTAFVVGSYVGIVGYLGSLLQTQDNTLLSLTAAGFVAISFHPLRERLQRGVNRLFYGQRDEPYAVITQLGERLQATLSPDAVLPTIAQTLQMALKSPYVAVALTQPDGSNVVRASAGETQTTDLLLPLIFNNNPVGQLQIAARQRDEAFDAVDQRFISEFAQSAAAAVHAVRLTDDLQLARQRLVNLREEERRRLRRDLHDGLGPALASISMQSDAARNLLPDTADPDLSLAREMLADVTNQAQSTMQEVRQLIHGLRPPVLDDLGLVAALRTLASNLTAGQLSSKFTVTVNAPDPLAQLPAAVEVATYRITQEALTNVVKHARASRCEITLLLQAGKLHLTIRDDGRGLPADRRAGVGLSSMRERAEELGGSWVIEPAVGGGAQVVLALPM